jgi:hypothetical protein
MTIRTSWTWSLGSLLFVLAGGCGHHFELTVPDDFVVLDDDNSSYAMRATSAHGIVMAVRELDNDPKGNLAFWVDAIRNKVRMNGGYALVEERDVTAGSGQSGKQLRFGRDQNGVAFRYWVTVFVGDSRIHVVEVGGREEIFTEAEPRIERAIAGLQID